MSKLGFYYNMDTCAACGTCQVACKTAHGLKPQEVFRRIEVLAVGPFSGTCNHCEDAACVKACPTGAMYKNEEGLTLHDDGKCIGCGNCMWNCPYGSISFSKTKGVTQKCDACMERREKGLAPACVNACPTSSIRFGEVEEASASLDFLPAPSVTKPSLCVNPSRRYKEADHA